jgi:hypothetical protein
MQLNHSLILYMAHPKLSTRPQAASIARKKTVNALRGRVDPEHSCAPATCHIA